MLCEPLRQQPTLTLSALTRAACAGAQDDEAAINEGLEADGAEARAAAGEAEPAAPGSAAPAAAAAEPAPLDDGDLSDGSPELDDVDGLLAKPPHSTEVFVSGLARTVTEEELRAAASPHGEIFELRLLTDAATGANRGYAFVVYVRREDAAAAAEALHNAEVKGRRVRASLSASKHRLFLGGLPKERVSRERLERLLRRAVVGIEAVELPGEPPARNRGFAFVDFHNTAAAEKARRTLSAPTFTVRGRPVTVSWAEPRADDSAAIAAVKSVYVSNLPDGCRPDELKAAFEQYGSVERVVIPQSRQGAQAAPSASAAPAAGDAAPASAAAAGGSPPAAPRARFGFVHFVERSAALAAADAAEKPQLGGNTLEVELAKPVADSGGAQPRVPGASMPQGRSAMGAGGIGPRGGPRHAQQQMMPPMAPPMAPGMPGLAPGMSLAPMRLPNGQIGYVLQQSGPGGPPPAYPPPYQQGPYGGGGRGYGRGGGGGRGSNNGRYRPY